MIESPPAESEALGFGFDFVDWLTFRFRRCPYCL